MEIDDHTKQMENDGIPGIAKEGRREREVEEDQEVPGPPKSAKAPPSPRPPSKFLRGMPRLENKLGSIDEGSTAVGWVKKRRSTKGL